MVSRHWISQLGVETFFVTEVKTYAFMALITARNRDMSKGVTVDSGSFFPYVALTKSSDNRLISARGRQILKCAPGDFAFLIDRWLKLSALDQPARSTR